MKPYNILFDFIDSLTGLEAIKQANTEQAMIWPFLVSTIFSSQHNSILKESIVKGSWQFDVAAKLLMQ